MDREETKQIFERSASHYDKAERLALAHLTCEVLLPYLAGSKQKSAMEYGCGTGLIGLELLDKFQSMLFVDNSPQMIAKVDEKLAQLANSQASTLCSDFVLDPLPSIKVDYILMVQVLLHVPETNLLLQRLYSLLNEGGHLLIVDFDKTPAITSDMVHNGFEQQQLCKELIQLGFAKAAGRTFYHGEKIFMNENSSLFIINASKAE